MSGKKIIQGLQEALGTLQGSAPKPCESVSPQCPAGQEEGYRLGWYHGQVAAFDDHHGTPCEQIRHAQELQNAIEVIRPFAEALRSARLALAKYPDRGEVVQLARRLVSYDDLEAALGYYAQNRKPTPAPEVTCPTCGGTGLEWDQVGPQVCDECGGSKTVEAAPAELTEND
jgi:hypothetical protein